MKKVLLVWWIVLLSLALVFGIVSIVLSVKKAYVELHYEQSRYEHNNGSFSIVNHYASYGCKESRCKYCNGQKVTNKIYNAKISFYTGFVYYRVLFSFWVVSLTLTAGCVAGGVTILVKWKKR